MGLVNWVCPECGERMPRRKRRSHLKYCKERRMEKVIGRCGFCGVFTDLEISGLCYRCQADPRKIAEIIRQRDEYKRLLSQSDKLMTFMEYQESAKRTAVYPEVGAGFVYPALGLCGEAGEVAERVKKIFRDRDGKVDAQVKEMIENELGDCLWYISQIATEFGLSLDDIAQRNLAKLLLRQQRGTLHGDGDER